MKLIDLEGLIPNDISRMIVIESLGSLEFLVPKKSVNTMKRWLYYNCPAYIRLQVTPLNRSMKKGVLIHKMEDM